MTRLPERMLAGALRTAAGRQSASWLGARSREVGALAQRGVALVKPLQAPYLPAPTFGIAMMAKDASLTLGAALSPALLALADDVVVLDSGSSDATPQLAASLGARVVHAPFGDGGFGEQQTRAVHASRADWVLILDADELVSSALLRRIPALIRTQGVAGWWLPRRWAVDLSGSAAWLQSAPHWPDYQPRLARRLPGLAYTGVIHQTLAPCAPRPWLVARGAPLVHLDLIVNDRASRESKVTQRMGTPGFAGTEGFYLWEDHPSVVSSLPEDEQEVAAALRRLRGPAAR